jgi:hypothetical protein
MSLDGRTYFSNTHNIRNTAKPPQNHQTISQELPEVNNTA